MKDIKQTEFKEEKEIKRNPFLFIDIMVIIIQFLIGFSFCYLLALPFTIFLHIVYLDKYGSFFIFKQWDIYLILISNIIFWIKIYSKNNKN